MARTRRGSGRWSDDFGRLAGEALGEGIANAMLGTMSRLREELKPLGAELAAAIVREAEVAAAEALPQSDPELGIRRCSEPGCIRRAIARGMCRRHYARQTYREKKERAAAQQGITPGAVPAPAPRAPRKKVEERPVVEERKVVAAVPPMVRKREAVASVVPIVPANTPVKKPAATPPNPAQQQQKGTGEAPTVVLDQVAKFFGRK